MQLYNPKSSPVVCVNRPRFPFQTPKGGPKPRLSESGTGDVGISDLVQHVVVPQDGAGMFYGVLGDGETVEACFLGEGADNADGNAIMWLGIPFGGGDRLLWQCVCDAVLTLGANLTTITGLSASGLVEVPNLRVVDTIALGATAYSSPIPTLQGNGGNSLASIAFPARGASHIAIFCGVSTADGLTPLIRTY